MFTESFGPEQATEFITSLINKKIQMCKIRFMREWVRNHDVDFKMMDVEIDRLIEQRERALQLIREAQIKGKKVNVEEILEFKLSA